MLAQGLGYRELGEAYLDRISQTRIAASLTRRPEGLGHIASRSNLTYRARERITQPRWREVFRCICCDRSSDADFVDWRKRTVND
jgi:hypothetical protein